MVMLLWILIEDVYEYVSKTYTINISCFVKQNLFSINKKYKPASCVLFPYLPPELWSLIVYYSRQPKICNVCGKYRKYYQYPVICKEWYAFTRNLPQVLHVDEHSYCKCFVHNVYYCCGTDIKEEFFPDIFLPIDFDY